MKRFLKFTKKSHRGFYKIYGKNFINSFFMFTKKYHSKLFGKIKLSDFKKFTEKSHSGFGKKIIRIAVVTIILSVSIGIYSYANSVSKDLENNIFRLHILANSDSIEDQQVKYEVRDSLLKYMQEISKGCKTKQEAIEKAKENKEQFEKIANDILQENGCDYTVQIEICKTTFPNKNYGDIELPKGKYDALEVKLGNAEGHNWWCVMYPSLCFVDTKTGIVPEESKELLRENLSEEDYSLITKQDQGYEFKFKVIEIFNNLLN